MWTLGTFVSMTVMFFTCPRPVSLQKVHEMLKKGWDAEGSPFRGQQFDPSMFDIPPSAVQFWGRPSSSERLCSQLSAADSACAAGLRRWKFVPTKEAANLRMGRECSQILTRTRHFMKADMYSCTAAHGLALRCLCVVCPTDSVLVFYSPFFCWAAAEMSTKSDCEEKTSQLLNDPVPMLLPLSRLCLLFFGIYLVFPLRWKRPILEEVCGDLLVSASAVSLWFGRTRIKNKTVYK